MKREVEFDIEKLEIGDEVYDILYGWLECVGIEKNGEIIVRIPRLDPFATYVYLTDGRSNSGQINPALIMIRKEIRIEDIPTKKFEKGEENYYINKCGERKWTVDYYMHIETYGANYYTEENARLVCKILNEELRKND